MSIIAVQGIPPKWDLVGTVKSLAKIIAGQFEALNFVAGPGKGMKTCYLRLSERLDPLQVVEKINSRPIVKKARLRALIPDKVPDIPLAAKARKIPQKLAKALRIPKEDSPDKVLVVTHQEILREMQYKFTGLFNLSRRTPGHRLLENIARTLFERLRSIMQSDRDAAMNCFQLSKAYRRCHPHFGDFQLILSTLHKIQDEKGAPRSQMTEDKLIVVNTEPCTLDNIPYSRLNSATSKYSQTITDKLMEHIGNLTDDGPPEEDAARRRVRQELRNMAQHLPSIVRQVIQKHLAPPKAPFYRMRIYGEPFLPNKEQMAPLTKRHRAVHIQRSDRVHNLLRLNVPPAQYSPLMAMDGTVLNGARLVVRCSDIPEYKVPPALKKEMLAPYGVEGDIDYGEEEEMDTAQ